MLLRSDQLPWSSAWSSFSNFFQSLKHFFKQQIIKSVTMAEPSIDSNGTWTAYPSLLSSLPETAQRTALEDAACAHYCGRYQDAEAIFDLNLALQRADMLTTQGREHERISLLKLVLGEPAVNTAELKSVQLLLKVMLADAEFWAFGQTEDMVNLLRTVRTFVRSRGINRLSDVEVILFLVSFHDNKQSNPGQIRIVGLYHTTVSSLEQYSNFIGEKDKTIFLDSKGDRAFELKCLRQVLQTQGRWRLAPIIMQLELDFSAPGSTLKEAIQDAFQLCASLETHTESPLKFRSAVLKKRLADQLSALEDPLCLNTTKEYIVILEDITGSSYSRWEDFCPVIVFDIKKTEIMTSEALYLEKVDQLLQLIEHAGRRNDFTKANQTYISAHSTAKEWLDTERKVRGAKCP
jgi:hypothetical protein